MSIFAIEAKRWHFLVSGGKSLPHPLKELVDIKSIADGPKRRGRWQRTRSRAANSVAAGAMLSKQRPAAIDPIGAKRFGEGDQDRRKHEERIPEARSFLFF